MNYVLKKKFLSFSYFQKRTIMVPVSDNILFIYLTLHLPWKLVIKFIIFLLEF